MTPLDALSGNGGAPHLLLPEDFRTQAHQELLAAPPWTFGICFLPECGCPFEPAREWQIYCSPKCKELAKAEIRRWGARMALPALVWRIGKYEADDEGVKSRTRVARKNFTQWQSAWLADRKARQAASFHINEEVIS